MVLISLSSMLSGYFYFHVKNDLRKYKKNNTHLQLAITAAKSNRVIGSELVYGDLQNLLTELDGLDKKRRMALDLFLLLDRITPQAVTFLRIKKETNLVELSGQTEAIGDVNELFFCLKKSKLFKKIAISDIKSAEKNINFSIKGTL